MPSIDSNSASLLSRFLRRLNADQEGTISIATVIALLVFTMLLGMVMNVGRQVDDKLKLQNGADAATYSAGVVMARGLNALAFSNHLLCEIFALTAYMREGRDRNAESLVPEILEAWKTAGDTFSRSEFRKFARLGPAIKEKVPLEQELVTAFGEMTAAKSKMTLPVLEYILGQPEQGGDQAAGGSGGQSSGAGQNSAPGGVTGGGQGPQSHLIPQFQRAVVQAIPQVALAAMREIAQRHCPGGSGTTRRNGAGAALLQSRGLEGSAPNEMDPQQRTVPAVDPSPEWSDAQGLGGQGSQYLASAVAERRALAKHYLDAWNNDPNFDIAPFHRELFSQGGKVSGKMSQFYNLWRLFTCGQLEKLLTEEFPTTNVPHMYRMGPQGVNVNDHTLLGVIYWPQMTQTFPGMYKSAIQGDALAFAEVMTYIPRARYYYNGNCGPWLCQAGNSCSNPHDCVDNWPQQWDLFNQNWTLRLVPATSSQLANLLQSGLRAIAPDANPPNLGGISGDDLKAVNTH